MDYLNIAINKKQYIMRNEYSKIIELDETGKKSIFDTTKQLPQDIRKIIEDAIIIKENPDDYFLYDLVADSDTEIEILEYIDNEEIKNVVIPEYIHGKKVVTMGSVFNSNKNIERIIIPETVESLNEHFCITSPSLEEVHLSSKITHLPHGCFFGSYNLKNINLENITRIGNEAFGNCYRLNNIDLKNTEVVDNYAFCWCMDLEEINAPNLMYIGDCAFSHCKQLKSIDFSDKLYFLGHSAFEQCYALKEIIIPEDIIKIKRATFKNCLSLKKVIFPNNLTEIHSEAFRNSNLEGNIRFPNTLREIESYAFAGTDINEVNISKNTYYNSSAFTLNQMLKIKIYDSPKEMIKDFFLRNIER